MVSCCMQKIKNYLHALSQLEKAVAAYRAAPDDALYRDGLIQRFEFTTELAWKSIKEYLEDQGATLPISTPRAVLKEAYSTGIITNDAIWSAILTARNLTSHVYDEKTADDIARQVSNDFLPVFKELSRFYCQ